MTRLAQLGDRVKDPISGFIGIAVVECRWLHGCVRIGVAPETLKDGVVTDERHFDQAQLVVIAPGVYLPRSSPTPPQPQGGPARETGNYRR